MTQAAMPSPYGLQVTLRRGPTQTAKPLPAIHPSIRGGDSKWASPRGTMHIWIEKDIVDWNKHTFILMSIEKTEQAYPNRDFMAIIAWVDVQFI